MILYENPGSPADYGLNPATTRLEMYSEFFNPPTPGKSTQTINESLEDETLNFGTFQIGRGKAYFLSDELEAADVGKSWVRIENRDFLIEGVPYSQVQPMLDKLDPRVVQSKQSVKDRKGLVAGLRLREKSVEVASIKPGRMPAQKGLVIDYTSLNTGQTDYIFKGDTTYFISGNVSLSGTNTTFEGGTVLKYTNSVALTVNTPVTWKGSSYRPVVLTARDDASVGEFITPSNSLSGYYATTALFFDANAATNSLTLQNLRVAHANTAVAISGRTGHSLTNVQVVNCANGISATNAQFSLRNALFNNVLTNITGSSSTGIVEHLTANVATWLNQDIGTNLFLTNCLLVAVTNYGSYTGSPNSLISSSSGVFQTVGQGYHYLASGSTNRNAGTTSINATLALQLQKLTTYPPIEQTNDFTANTTLSPQAQRDTDTPDYGYHYDPLDYVWTGLNVTNTSTLTPTNGVAIGIYGTKGTTLRNGAKLIGEGTPVNLNRLVRYQTVQEQPIIWGTTAATMNLIDLGGGGEARLRFTDLSVMANTTARRTLLDHQTSYGTIPFEFTHSQLRGMYQVFDDSANPGNVVSWTNNYLERCNITWKQSDSFYYPFTLYLYNNLFYKGAFTFTTTSNTPSWTVKYNLFDSDSLTKTGSPTFTRSNNGYRSGLTSLGGSNNKTVTNMDYQIGPLGNYYYPTNGGHLSQLLDAGSRSATNAILYHFTTTTNQVKEATSTVDIGYHYVAVDGNGQPLDNDGDGLPDYFEDRNGNGTADTGETDWQSADDLGLKVWITEPKSNSNIP